jgi:hypothetical protein
MVTTPTLPRRMRRNSRRTEAACVAAATADRLMLDGILTLDTDMMGRAIEYMNEAVRHLDRAASLLP